MKICCISLVAFLIFGRMLAQKKTFIEPHYQEFRVNKELTVMVDNQLGDVQISTWKRNKVLAEVSMIAKAEKEIVARQRFLEFEVSMLLNEGKDTLQLTTVLSESIKSLKSYFVSLKDNFRINCYLKIPEKSRLKIKNESGNITIDKLKNDADILLSYGEIYLGKLEGTSNKITINHAKGSLINTFGGGELDINFSTIELCQAKKQRVILKAQYSDIRFDHAAFVQYETTFGQLSIRNANKIKGFGKYSDLFVGNLTESLAIKANYGIVDIRNVQSKVSTVSVVTDHTKVDFGLGNGWSFDYRLDLKKTVLHSDLDFSFDKKTTTALGGLLEGGRMGRRRKKGLFYLDVADGTVRLSYYQGQTLAESLEEQW